MTEIDKLYMQGLHDCKLVLLAVQPEHIKNGFSGRTNSAVIQFVHARLTEVSVTRLAAGNERRVRWAAGLAGYPLEKPGCMYQHVNYIQFNTYTVL